MSSDALFGVFGTLLGVILGYALNECSKRGKNKISFEDVDILCQNYGITNCTIGISMTLNVINSSSDTKNIIKPKIILKKNSKVLMEGYIKMQVDKHEYKDYLCCHPKIFTSIKLNEVTRTIPIDNPPDKLIKMTDFFENCELFLNYINDHGKIKKKRIYKDCLHENEKFKYSLELKQKESRNAMINMFSIK